MVNKLHYYPATGRGHALRLALATGGIEWEDTYPEGGYPPSEEQVLKWRAIGGNTTTNVPMLEMEDGKVYTQSSAVLRVIGRMGNLMPSSDEDLYLVDKLIADAEDLRDAAYKSFVNWGASQDDVKKFMEDNFPKHVGNLDRQLGSKEYFVGDSLSIADIAVYDVIVNFGTNRFSEEMTPLESFPKIQEFVKRVESNDGIASYLNSDKYANVYKFGKETLGLYNEEERVFGRNFKSLPRHTYVRRYSCGL